MANFNPVAIVRELSSAPEHTRGVHLIAGRLLGGGTDAVTIETNLKTVIGAIVYNETDATVLAVTIASSTAHTGTQKVTFTVANSKAYNYLIFGLYDRTITSDTTSGSKTITYEPVKGT
jgi:hypothetical protein